MAPVVSGPSGKNAHWYFEKSDDKYLDGAHNLIVIFATPRRIKHPTLKISEASALYDLKYKEDEAYTRKGEEIDVKIKESKPKP